MKGNVKASEVTNGPHGLVRTVRVGVCKCRCSSIIPHLPSFSEIDFFERRYCWWYQLTYARRHMALFLLMALACPHLPSNAERKFSAAEVYENGGTARGEKSRQVKNIREDRQQSEKRSLFLESPSLARLEEVNPRNIHISFTAYSDGEKQ